MLSRHEEVSGKDERPRQKMSRAKVLKRIEIRTRRFFSQLTIGHWLILIALCIGVFLLLAKLTEHKSAVMAVLPSLGTMAPRNVSMEDFWKEFVVKNMSDDEFYGLSDSDRVKLLRSVRAAEVVLNPTATRMHGMVGYKDNGLPYYEPQEMPEKDMNMAVELRRGGGFNLALSDALPLDREIIDSRDDACKLIEYDYSKLPRASVVIIFYNEPFSTLFRSVHSVLNLTPPQLLQEIVLVDDGGDQEWITGGMLESYVSLLPKVRLVRNKERLGIVGARMAGIRAAVAPVFVILDSHIEVQQQWLEPIVQRIGEDETRIVMPTVDGITQETLEQRKGGIGCTLGFLWKLIEHSFDADESSVPERRHATVTDFVSSPTMAGGLFAASTSFFFKIGAYDEQFFYWGTENLELSFRLWMCGGRLECSQCSRVYHIFRKGGVGYSSPPFSTTKNKMRTLTIWMDEYADLAWRVLGQPVVDFGEYESNKKWREDMKCHDFKWFLHNINPESVVKVLPDDVPYLGQISNLKSKQCIDTGVSDGPGSEWKLYSCHGGSNQQFMYFNQVHHIMPVSNDESCLSSKTPGVAEWCSAKQQRIRVREMPQLNATSGKHEHVGPGHNALVMLKSETLNHCLAARMGMLDFVDCDEGDTAQMWSWPKYNPPKVFTPPPVGGGLRKRLHD